MMNELNKLKTGSLTHFALDGVGAGRVSDADLRLGLLCNRICWRSR